MSLIKFSGFKSLWVRGMRRARDEYEETQSDIEHARPFYRWLIYAFLVYILCAVCVGIYWSSTPEPVDIRSAMQRQMSLLEAPATAPISHGVATTSALIAIADTLLDKPGGYISNDVFPPGIWLDNMPHWELGALIQLRDTTQILRSSFSQTNLNHDLDVDLQKAEVRFNFSNSSWGFPATESQYGSGIEHLQEYNFRLLRSALGNAQFHADAQHLNDYLAGVEQRLKILSQRLTASVGPSVESNSLDAESKQGKKIVSSLYKKTPWYKADNVFYEARGSSWALIAVLEAIEIDFSDALQNKSARASYEQIIRELKPTQDTVLSPIILNGDGFGLVANHSLTMASYLARAQAAISDCRRQLLVPSSQ